MIGSEKYINYLAIAFTIGFAVSEFSIVPNQRNQTIGIARGIASSYQQHHCHHTTISQVYYHSSASACLNRKSFNRLNENNIFFSVRSNKSQHELTDTDKEKLKTDQ